MIGIVLEIYNFNEKISKGTNYVYEKNYYTVHCFGLADWNDNFYKYKYQK